MQFFHNVKLENPRITVADNERLNLEEQQSHINGKSNVDINVIPCQALTEVKTQIQEEDSRSVSGRKYDFYGDRREKNQQTPLGLAVSSGVVKSNSDWNICMIEPKSPTVDSIGIPNHCLPETSKAADVNIDEDNEKKRNKARYNENGSAPHRSRRELFDDSSRRNRDSSRERSRSGKSSRKADIGGRSRSTSETEKDAQTKQRNKDRKYNICDGIPQKYLSLLGNMSISYGDGGYDSYALHRSRTLREPRRQRPSRLTSNLTDYKAMIYIPCVRLAISELISKCNNPRVRHYYLASCVLLDMLSSSEYQTQELSFEVIYHWVLTNREDICIIFDNVDSSEVWERLISDAYHDTDGFGKIIVATTPGRIPKRNVDSLFYCYGLSTEYSNRIVTSRLKREAPDVTDRIQYLLNSNHTQELLCNPLSLSLLSAYFRSVKKNDEIPEHLSELLEHLIQHAMAHEVKVKVAQSNNVKGRKRRVSLQSVCETVAFECLENDTNYFSKQKFPYQFWFRHLCDCRVLHEVHEIANFGPIHERIPSPTTTNLSLTPDSDSVHSSSSSILDLNTYSDYSSSCPSLALGDNDTKDNTALNRSGLLEIMPKSSSPDNVSQSNTGKFVDGCQTTSSSLLKVPSMHGLVDSSKKTLERPKTLALDTKRQQGKLPQKSTQQNQNSSEVVSFTSRCIRDFLASKRVCRYLQSDRDSEAFIQRLIAKPRFYPVLRLTVRSLYISQRADLILYLLDMLLLSQEFINSQSPTPQRGSSHVHSPEPPKRGRLHQKYRLSSSDCPFRAKLEEHKQRRSSTSVLGSTFGGGSLGLNTSSSFNRFLNTAALNPHSSLPSSQIIESRRGYLDDFKEALIWLAETDNSEPYIGAVSNRFPEVLVICHQECPSETIEHFICLVKRSSPPIKEVVLYISGFYTQWDLGIRMAETLQDLQSVTIVNISMKCVMETAFLVDFICECFEHNEHIETLRLEGPMNVAENLTFGEHKRVQRIFNRPCQKLQTLILDRFSFNHRVGYILDCWPNVFKNLEIKKSNLEGMSEKITNKLSKSSPLEYLSLDNCYMHSSTVRAIVKHIGDAGHFLKLNKLQLTILSSSRRFTKTDTKRPHFKPTITRSVCQALADMITSSTGLRELLLSYNGISTENAKIVLRSVAKIKSLTLLDLTGNLIGNDVEDDVILLISKHPQLTSLFLGDNNITKETRSAIIKESLNRIDLRLSL